MRTLSKTLAKRLAPACDLAVSPIAFVCALLLRLVRRIGIERLPRTRRMLLRAGAFPIRRHYYEPAFDNEGLRSLLAEDRDLPGINWNEETQLSVVATLAPYATELSDIPQHSAHGNGFYLHNRAFEAGDAEFWYAMIRWKKPMKIVEIGSGFSTRMARVAIEANHRDEPEYVCEHVLIEPYEHDWLENLDVTLIREKVEDCGLDAFEQLGANDILFIDSSHMIRPRGDVLQEYLEILPRLKAGVIVHIHDIFSPKDYPATWLVDEVRLWNEQYLVEAFLTQNNEWQILSALNYLSHRHFEKLSQVTPFLTHDREPGSLYIQKVK